MSILDLFRKKETTQTEQQTQPIQIESTKEKKEENDYEDYGFDSIEENIPPPQNNQQLLFTNSTPIFGNITNFNSNENTTEINQIGIETNKNVEEDEEQLMKTDIKDGNIEDTCLFSHFNIDEVQGWKSFVHTTESDNQWSSIHSNVNHEIKRFQQHANK